MDPATLNEACRLLCLAAFHASFNAPDTPHGRAFRERTRNPVVGDFVVEVSTFRGDDHADRCGRLLRVECVPWSGDPALNRGCEVWTIRTLDGRELRWADCEWVACPEGVDWPPWSSTGSLDVNETTG